MTLRNAAEWMVREHHHDYGLMNDKQFERRVTVVIEQFEPFLEAMLHLPVEERMELMGMRGVLIPATRPGPTEGWPAWVEAP